MSGDVAPLVPEGFLFGVGTSGFQVEGGFNGSGEPANNWLWWERSGRVEPSGLACDFWNRPEEALDRAASIGCDAFRLSVEWARVEPADGEVDERAIDRYAAILAMCADRGMAPVVTLHHFTHPWWLGTEYWLTPGSPDRFDSHARRVLPALVPYCRRWVTINEPNIVALTGWVSGAYPPGRRGAASDAWAVLDNLLTAHVLAYRTIHRLQPDAQVTMNTSASTIYDHDRLLTDLLSARTLGVGATDLDEWLDERRTLHDETVRPTDPAERLLRRLFASTCPYGSNATAPSSARRKQRVPRRVVDVLYASPSGGSRRGREVLDAAGIDWYDPVASHGLRCPGHRTAGGRNALPFRLPWDVAPDPGAFERWSARGLEHPFCPPVWIVENGIASRVRNGRSYPRLDGWDRPRYLRAHLSSLVRALETGARIEAYLHWSLVDNYEWGSYEPRFGLFGMDRSRGERGVRWLSTDAAGCDSPGTYRALIAAARDGDRDALRGAVGTQGDS